MSEGGHDLTNIKIMWKRNQVKLNGNVVYALLKDDPSGADKHDYNAEGLAVQDEVEQYIKQWIQKREGEDDN